MDAKTQRLLLYAALIALAYYVTVRTGAFAGAGRAVDSLSGQPITPTDYTFLGGGAGGAEPF